jgi:hypothetical protein
MHSSGRPMSRTRIPASCAVRTTSISRPACIGAGRYSSPEPKPERGRSHGSANGPPDRGRLDGYRRINGARLVRLGAPAPPRLRRPLGGGDELSQKDRRRPPRRNSRGARAGAQRHQGAAGLRRIGRRPDLRGGLCRAGTSRWCWLGWGDARNRPHLTPPGPKSCIKAGHGSPSPMTHRKAHAGRRERRREWRRRLCAFSKWFRDFA